MRYKHVFAIPAYGQSPWLETCIRSLKVQSQPSPVILCTSSCLLYTSATFPSRSIREREKREKMAGKGP